jgi:hypothetical protein
MKKYLRNFLFGKLPVSEYSTVTTDQPVFEKVFFDSGENVLDVSVRHWLLCLDPIVFGVWFEKDNGISYSKDESVYTLRFMNGAANADTVAVLKLTYFNQIEDQEGRLLLLKLKKVNIHHLGFVKTLLLYYRYYKKAEQNFYKLKSYAAAYSYPRRVRLVSFQEEGWYNIFPMDLVGDLSFSRRYVFGLRHSNVTLARMIAAKKIVVSEIPYEYKDIIYQLGKYHRKPLSEIGTPFGIIQSEFFRFPVPEWANGYKEIRISDCLNLGSHMLLWGEVVNNRDLSESHGHLFHIHFLHYLHQIRGGRIYKLV